MKLRHLLFACLGLLLASCAKSDRATLIRVSVPNQRMLVFKNGVQIASYRCSTSKFGVGDRPGSYRTPLGRMKVAAKIGNGLPSGMKLKSRRPTGEIVKPNSPGRDPIVSRILWLRGLEGRNRNAYGRAIYIHGTAEERTIGTPSSYGCIRMTSRDVISLYNNVGLGALVEVSGSSLPAPLAGPMIGATAPAAKFSMRSPAPAATATAPKPSPVVASVKGASPRS